MIQVGDLVMYVHPDEPVSGMVGYVTRIEQIDEPDWYTGPYYTVDLMHHDNAYGPEGCVFPIYNQLGERITQEWLEEYERNVLG